MKKPKKYWIKLYLKMLESEQVGLLSDAMKWRWVSCLLMAGDHDDEGFLPDVDTMAWKLRVEPARLQDEMRTLASRGLVELAVDGQGTERWLVSNFAELQAPSPSAQRVREHRQRKKEKNQKKERNTDKRRKEAEIQSTYCNVTCNVTGVTKRYTSQQVGDMLNALGDVCGMSPTMNYQVLEPHANTLLVSDYSPEQVMTLYSRPSSWWYQHDWRGKRGDYPRPAQVVETIYGALNHVPVSTQPARRLSKAEEALNASEALLAEFRGHHEPVTAKQLNAGMD